MRADVRSRFSLNLSWMILSIMNSNIAKFIYHFQTGHPSSSYVRMGNGRLIFFFLALRGQATTVQASPTAGSVVLDERKQLLKWDVGQRFASRKLEVALPASIVFDGQSRSTDILDPFCSGSNCYVQVSFRLHTIPEAKHSSTIMFGWIAGTL